MTESSNATLSHDRRYEFLKLCDSVAACQLCARMCGSTRVIGFGCGSLDAKIMFIGEAPGRHGAEKTVLPFHGDQAGHNFDRFLYQVGISRADAFITNAVLCNPKDEIGNNSTPSVDEVRNCSENLKRQILLVDPKIVVTLGAIPLRSLNSIEPHNLQLRDGVRTANRWFNRTLIPIYHPGQRALIHRSFANQLSDYQFIAETMRRSSARKPNSRTVRRKDDVYAVVTEIIETVSEVSYFALHKLLFLIEYESVRRSGARATDAYIVRQKDGPYCVDLHYKRLLDAMPNLKMTKRNGELFLSFGVRDMFERDEKQPRILRKDVLEAIELVVQRHGISSNAEIKKAAYLTKPMRDILRAEKRDARSLFNSPIAFS